MEDQLNNEIIRVIGGLESAVTGLNKQLDGFSGDLKTLSSTCVSFELYAKSRANLPERLAAVEAVAQDYIKGKPDAERLTEKVEFLIKRYDAAMIAAAVLNAIALLIVFLVQKGILKVGL
jgi:hypothetical protein